MTLYSIKWKSSARKEIKKLPKDIIIKIINTVDKLTVNPFPTGSRKLTGTQHTYRLRVGNYRIVYSVESDNLVILIIRIRHRKDVYKNLP